MIYRLRWAWFAFVMQHACARCRRFTFREVCRTCAHHEKEQRTNIDLLIQANAAKSRFEGFDWSRTDKLRPVGHAENAAVVAAKFGGHRS